MTSPQEITSIQQTVPAPRTARRWARRILVISFIIVPLLILTTIGFSVYIGWQLTHPVRKFLQGNPGEIGLIYSNVEFPSRVDQVLLKGWLIPSQAKVKKHMTIIFSHGYRGNRTQPNVPSLSIAKALSIEGYDLLLFDFRDCGESGGNFTSIGQYETNDLLGAIDWVRQKGLPGQSVALLGFSMGASTAIMAAAADPSVVGVVADSPFSNLSTYLENNLSVWSHLPKYPFTPLIMGILPVVLKLDPSKVNPIVVEDNVYPRPILFIHSMADNSIPYMESEIMWSKHKDHFQIWKSDKGEHIGTYREHPEEYINRISSFFGALVPNS